MHTADLHLDSAMAAHLSATAATARRKELLLSFSNILMLAAAERVKLLLIGGDLFDTPSPSRNAVRYFIDQCARYGEIEILLIEGNHDAGALRDDELPANLHLVRAGDAQCFRYGDTAVYAAGWGVTPDAFAAFLPKGEDCNIYLLHGAPADDGAEGLLPTAPLAHPYVDYVALGHYHTYTCKPCGRGTLCYAGIPEGRGFDETGACGVVLFDTEKRQHEFRKTASRTLHALTLDLSPFSSQSEIEEAIRNMTADIPEKDMVRLVLCGAFNEKTGKDAGQIKAYLDNRFYFARLKDESRFAVRPEDYRNDISLRGEFVRRVLAAPLSEEDKAQVLAYGLRALGGEEPEEL